MYKGLVRWWVFLVTCLLVSALRFPASALARNQVIIINQVRGRECCDAGSVEATRTQVRTFREHQLPAYFALRYDALVDPAFSNLFTALSSEEKAFIHPAVFLEITPQLAADADVLYRGNEQHWYLAQNAYPVGYTADERRRLVATLLDRYRLVFGVYPQVSVGWLVDTPTLNQLRDDYGVLIHEITREQWGTDSYTLDGGPVHYPYPAARSWAFMPDYAAAKALTIVRQTVSDPLMNYGDTQSWYTSQPNDYQRAGRSLDYFQRLVTQALHQPEGQPGFAVLGLENSMPEIAQEEYRRQIAWLAEKQGEYEVEFPTAEALQQFWQRRPLNVYEGKDLLENSPARAIWVTTPSYRVRLRNFDQRWQITDLRVYNSAWRDPYTDHEAFLAGHWAVPFLINSARVYEDNLKNNPYPFGLRPRSDRERLGQHVVFSARGAGEGEMRVYTESAELRHEGRLLGQFGIASFSSTSSWPRVVLGSDHALQPVRLTKQKLEAPGSMLTWSCARAGCQYVPTATTDHLSELRRAHPLWLFPETNAREFAFSASVLFAHNRTAIVGRNPVRVVLIPQDDRGVPALLTEPVSVAVDQPVQLVSDPAALYTQREQFYDFVSSEPGRMWATFHYQGQSRRVRVTFAPDCARQLRYCLGHPLQSWWYVWLKATEVFQR